MISIVSVFYINLIETIFFKSEKLFTSIYNIDFFKNIFPLEKNLVQLLSIIIVIITIIIIYIYYYSDWLILEKIKWS